MDFIMDEEAVENLIIDEWTDEDWRVTGLTNLQDLKDFDLYLVKVRDVVLGCCAIQLHENGAAELAVYLRQEYRGRGVGEDMVRSIHHVVKSLGANYAFSLVREDNEIMQKLLDKFGHDTYSAMEAGFVIRGLEL